MLIVVVKTVEVEVTATGVLVVKKTTVLVFVHGINDVVQVVLTFDVEVAQRDV